MTLTNDLLLNLDAEADNIEAQGPLLAAVAPDGVVDSEKLAEAQEYLALARQLLAEAQAALDQSPPDDATYKRKTKIASELMRKAREKIDEAAGLKK
jgi:hypothetical protein